jgi:NADH dehydrogenase
MILVTGGTGFIGRKLVAGLTAAGQPVRVLIRPSPQSPELPKGVPVEAAIANLNDERSLRAALSRVKIVYHLAGEERRGAYGNLMASDIAGTQALVRAAADAGVERIFFLSHLGADRASAYPLLKVKAIAEESIRRSGIAYTILRSAVVFGPGDHFTSGLAWLAHAAPFFFLLPGDGRMLMQPVWIDDLVTSLVWALDDPSTINQTYEVGGAEYLSMRQIAEIVLQCLGRRRLLVNTNMPLLRGLTVFLESLFPHLPVSIYWMDYLATNRTCALDTLPRTFHLIPTRFTPAQLNYLRLIDWRAYTRQALAGLLRGRPRRQKRIR